MIPWYRGFCGHSHFHSGPCCASAACDNFIINTAIFCRLQQEPVCWGTFQRQPDSLMVSRQFIFSEQSVFHLTWVSSFGWVTANVAGKWVCVRSHDVLKMILKEPVGGAVVHVVSCYSVIQLRSFNTVSSLTGPPGSGTVLEFCSIGQSMDPFSGTSARPYFHFHPNGHSWYCSPSNKLSSTCTAIMGKSEKSQHEVCGLSWNLWVGLKQEVEEEVPSKQVLKSWKPIWSLSQESNSYETNYGTIFTVGIYFKRTLGPKIQQDPIKRSKRSSSVILRKSCCSETVSSVSGLSNRPVCSQHRPHSWNTLVPFWSSSPNTCSTPPASHKKSPVSSRRLLHALSQLARLIYSRSFFFFLPLSEEAKINCSHGSRCEHLRSYKESIHPLVREF